MNSLRDSIVFLRGFYDAHKTCTRLTLKELESYFTQDEIASFGYTISKDECLKSTEQKVEEQVNEAQEEKTTSISKFVVMFSYNENPDRKLYALEGYRKPRSYSTIKKLAEYLCMKNPDKTYYIVEIFSTVRAEAPIPKLVPVIKTFDPLEK